MFHAAPGRAFRIRTMKTLRYRSFWLALAWSLVVLVTVLSLLPQAALPDVEYNDKLEHMTAYVVLMGLFGQILGPRTGLVILLLAMGALIEVLQGLSGYRDMSFLDWLADAAGIAAGWLLSFKVPGLLTHIEERLP